jgi:hypothetical protein
VSLPFFYCPWHRPNDGAPQTMPPPTRPVPARSSWERTVTGAGTNISDTAGLSTSLDKTLRGMNYELIGSPGISAKSKVKIKPVLRRWRGSNRGKLRYHYTVAYTFQTCRLRQVLVIPLHQINDDPGYALGQWVVDMDFFARECALCRWMPSRP